MGNLVKIFTSAQIKRADEYTILHEPISSIDLMERAAAQCTQWLKQRIGKKRTLLFFCGPGNNGGDGLAIARQLHLSGYTVCVCKLELSKNASEDFLTNEKRFRELPGSDLKTIHSIAAFPEITDQHVIIDAIFGTGLNKQVTGLAAECIERINSTNAEVIAIDLPSGLFADIHSPADFPVINADHTLSFQFPKTAFFFAENEHRVGDWHILNIGLNEKFIAEEPSQKFLLTGDLLKPLIKSRQKFSHKGTFGHVLLVAGSYGKMGAAVLSARACLHSGAGLLTVHIPKSGYEIIQITCPEAMASIDSSDHLISDNIESSKFSSIAIGPGIGTAKETGDALRHIFSKSKTPLVLDADALNLISMNEELLKLIPAGSILTPHPKEFERLTKKAKNDFERHALQLEFSQEHQIYVVLKGAHTCISTPTGDAYFNTTGNPGMAKGGSGDVLTGVIAGLLAQGYTSLESTLLGVYIHGLAGDLAKKDIGETGMVSSDITNHIAKALFQIQN